MATTTSKAGYRSGRDLPTVAENIELLTGQRGNKLDKAITYRELADIGLITLSKAANNALSPSAAPGVLPDDTIGRPVAPTGVIANGAFHTILVEWDLPAYKGHAHAEVWRAEEDNRAKAVMVGTSAANLYSDAIGKGASVFYWVRFVNKVNVQGPFQGVAGVHAETSRDVQDILNELQGKISASHLVQELLAPIQSVSQLQIDLGDLDDALSQTKASIAALDAREVQVNDLLQHAQTQLGDNYISVSIIQEQLRQRIDTYNLNFQSFRDAVFAVNPTTGEITMDAVNAVRSELGAEITTVSQHLDSVEAIVNTCVTRAELSADFERLTLVEQQIDGINATLTQTATKSEVSSVASTVSQVQQSLDATNNALTQKAAQSQVDSQGQRLSVAEQQISASATANSATAQRIEQVKSQLELADQTITSSITELTQSIATDKQATAQRLSAMEATISGQTAAISELQQVVTGDGSSLASKFESISASTDLAAEAAMQAALANASADIEQRKAAGKIRTSQEALSNDVMAQAQTIVELSAEFDAEKASTTAALTEIRTTMTDADQALSQRLDSMDAAYKAADSATNASMSSLAQAVSTADLALAQQISLMDAAYKQADAATSASIATEQSARASGDQALSVAISQMDAAYKAADSSLTSRVATEELARATADGALSSRIDQVTANFTSADNSLQGQITSESSARASADQALSNQISTVTATANDTSATVQTHSQSIASLQNGAQAMWTAKANAGGITAGIGLIAKSDGTSQVAISASQVFVFDPNSPNALSPLFAIDNGQVIMAEAIIRTATIQILNSQQITADYVKAGVSLSAPVINGGSIVIGSNFTVTASGAMTAWSATLRYVTSHYGTFNYATMNNATIATANITNATITTATITDATIDDATIKNCVIEEDCTVLGTFYAKNMQGDISAIKAVAVNTAESVYDKTVVSETIKSAEFSRDLFIDGLTVNIGKYTMPSVAGSVVIRSRLKKGTSKVVDAVSYIKKPSTVGSGVTYFINDRDIPLPAVITNGIGLTQASYSVMVSVYWQPSSGSESYDVVPFSVIGAATIKVQKTASDTFA
jgi:hypothetical protein